MCQDSDNLTVAGGRQLDKGIRRLGNFSGKQTQSRSVYDADGLSPTLCASAEYGNIMPYVQEHRGGKRGVVLTNQGKVFQGYMEIALTLMSRDYKGFGNQQMVGVEEREGKV